MMRKKPVYCKIKYNLDEKKRNSSERSKTFNCKNKNERKRRFLS